jgi:hypothetical protein
MSLAAKLPYTHPFAGGYPYRGSQRLPSDPDALTYLAAVAAADGAPVEVGVATAVDDFFKGCKADGTFSAWKAACLLCGARTLAGALVPLAGTAPTNNNFVDADYNRETGLIGNGSTKYLDSNRAGNADGQNDSHASVYVSALPTKNARYIGVLESSPLKRTLQIGGSGGNDIVAISNAGDISGLGGGYKDGFFGLSRNNATGYSASRDGVLTSFSVASASRVAGNILVFAELSDITVAANTDARLAFYSIGSAIDDLAAFNSRATALVTAIGAAL